MIGIFNFRKYSLIMINFSLIKRKNELAAFSLMEVIVSVSLFSIIILSMTGIFKMVISAQRGAIATQNVQESLKYFLEVINKEIRMAIRSDGDCGVPEGKMFYITTEYKASNVIYFKNFYGECVSYGIASDNDGLTGRFYISRDYSADFISPRQIDIKNLKFILNGGQLNVGPQKQDLITISIQAQSLGAPEADADMVIQTSLSSRYYK